MTHFNLRERLESAAQLRDPYYALDDTITALEVSGCRGASVVATLFDFIEKHPLMDMGATSPLCRFLVAYEDYQEPLLLSLTRRPTIYSVAMLYSLIIVAPTENERKRLVTALKAVLEHPDTEDYLRDEVREFLLKNEDAPHEELMKKKPPRPRPS